MRTANTGGAIPFASQVTISAEGQHTVEYRSVDKAGNAETAKTVAFGIDIPDPGFPVIQAFADPTSGTAPLLVRFSATGFDPDGGQLTYKWEFADGARSAAAPSSGPSPAGHVHGKVTATDDEGDTTSQEVTVTVRAPGVEPPTVEASSSVHGGPAPRQVAVHRRGQRPRRAGGRPAATRGTSATAARRSRRTRATRTCCPGTYTAKVTVSDGSGATATKTITITVTDPPGNQAPVVEADAICRSRHRPAGGARSRPRPRDPDKRHADVRVGLRRRLARRRRPRRQAHVHDAPAPTTPR